MELERNRMESMEQAGKGLPWETLAGKSSAVVRTRGGGVRVEQNGG